MDILLFMNFMIIFFGFLIAIKIMSLKEYTFLKTLGILLVYIFFSLILYSVHAYYFHTEYINPILIALDTYIILHIMWKLA